MERTLTSKQHNRKNKSHISCSGLHRACQHNVHVQPSQKSSGDSHKLLHVLICFSKSSRPLSCKGAKGTHKVMGTYKTPLYNTERTQSQRASQMNPKLMKHQHIDTYLCDNGSPDLFCFMSLTSTSVRPR